MIRDHFVFVHIPKALDNAAVNTDKQDIEII